MLRIHRKRAVLEDSRQKNARDQISDSDVGLEAATKTFLSHSFVQEPTRSRVDQTSVSAKAREHPHTEILNQKKKKRQRTGSIKTDDSLHTVTVSKKAKRSKSNSDPVQLTEEKNEKLRSAAVEDSRRKKKRKVDFDGRKHETAVSDWKSKPDSVTERTASTVDPAVLPSTSSMCDLQHLEDSIVDDFASVRNELSNMPIADLLQLKERLGAKIYDEVMFGTGETKKVSMKKFPRENKNRPMEMSSKRPVAMGRTDMHSRKDEFVSRDPRFDDLSGEFNESYFKQSYGFLSDIKLREKQKLLKMAKKTKDANKSAQLHQLITRMTQQERAEQEHEEKRRREQAWKKKERERISQGKRPFFLKKSEKRKLELAEKFRKLEQSGKLEQFIAKKKKKNFKTEKKSLPRA